MENLSPLDQTFNEHLSTGCLFTALGVVELSGLTNNPILICMICVLSIPFVVFTILRIKNRSKKRDKVMDDLLKEIRNVTTCFFFLVLNIGILCILCCPTFRNSMVDTVGILFFVEGIYELFFTVFYFFTKYTLCKKLKG